MYTFRSETDKNAFEEFVLSHGGIYMQSAKWAEVKLEWKSRFYSGFGSDGQRVLSALILERRIPAAGNLWYCPAGAVCDYSDSVLLKEFTDFIKSEMKAHGGTALFFDPCIELRRNAVVNETGLNVHKSLVSCGFSLNTDASKCLYKSPVQIITSLISPDGTPYTPEKLLKSFDKGVRYSVRIGEQRGLTSRVYTIEDVEKDKTVMSDFLAVMHDTSERDDFVERSGDYCERLMRVFGRDGMDIMLVYYDRAKDTELQNLRLSRKEELIQALENAPEKKIRGIKEEIESIDKQTGHYEERISETGGSGRNEICVAGGLTVHYGNMSSCLFGGAKNLLRNNLRSSHFFNFRRICRSIELNNAYHDLGFVLLKNTPPNPDGTLGECVPNDDFTGIKDFKMSFGGDYIEYIGEYVLVGNPALYFSYTHLIHAAREVQSKVNRIVRARRDK